MAKLHLRRSRSLLTCWAMTKNFSSNTMFWFASGKKNTTILMMRIM